MDVRWSLGFMLAAVSACHVGRVAVPPSSELEHGGVFVAYNLGCERGCRDVARGDVILAVDGQVVETRDDLLASGLTDDRDVRLDVLRHGESTPRQVTIRARPGHDLPPLENTPPFWTVSASALDRAPDWARAMMFSHALPALELIDVDGGWINGRDLYGRKTIIVVWPDLPMFRRQYRNFRDQMSTFYRVLQKAQPDLAANGVGIVFAVCGGSNDTTVRQELQAMGEHDAAGNPYPPLPTYRCPGLQASWWAPTAGGGLQADAASSPARHLGLENSAQDFFEYVRGFPVVVVVDEGGIVRWHTNGYIEGPQNTILGAVTFALESLDERAPTVARRPGGGPTPVTGP